MYELSISASWAFLRASSTVSAGNSAVTSTVDDPDADRDASDRESAMAPPASVPVARLPATVAEPTGDEHCPRDDAVGAAESGRSGRRRHARP